jgi:23S rRNA pseudouridine1911/1915/1917 synthase
MNTSGVVIFAKAPDVVAVMHDQFREQRVHKQYLAICMGTPSQSTFTVNAGIGPHPVVK